MWDGTWNGGRHSQTSLILSICYSDRSGDNPRPLSNSPAATVAGPPSEPLTASFSGMSSEHAGEGTFTFGLTFSDEVTLSYKTLRDAALNERRRGAKGRARAAGQQPGVGDHGRAGVGRRGDDRVAGDDRLRRERRDLHRRRPAAVAFAVGDHRRSGGDLGGRRAGGRKRRGAAGLHGHVEPRDR